MDKEKQRIDWSAVMESHGMEPDADHANPAVEPDRAPPEPRRRRVMTALVAATALATVAASVAVLLAILGSDRGADQAADADDALTARLLASPRPAAYQSSSDGVAVVPAEAAEAPAAPPAADPAAPAAAPPARPAARKPAAGRQTAAKPAGASAEKPPAPEPSGSAEAAPPPGEPLPDEPDQAAVAAAMEKLQKPIEACAASAGVHGEVGLKMRVEPDGSVPWASAKLENSGFQACLDRLFKKARMPRSARGATVRRSLTLP